MSINKPPKYIIGIDEVGRGPVAGPVAVGAVVYAAQDIEILKETIVNVRDSKKLSQKRRGEVFAQAIEKKKEGLIDFSVGFIGPKTIDEKGIVYAIKESLRISLTRIAINPDDCVVLLDGGLYAPDEYKNQSTIIKGDQKEFAISLASIIAKVSRDKKMVDMGKEFPGYGFEKHKGYGTRQHMVAIKELGMLDVHRKSFLKNIV